MLPYRVDPGDLTGLVEGRARGRSMEQLSSLYARKAFEGLKHAADVFGLIDRETGELTDRGRQLALAENQRRQEIMLEGMMEFEPYDLLVEAAMQRDSDTTTLDWIQTWWGSQGFGSSENNRAEGASTFGRLINAAGLGTYIQGRRGHSSRIEWETGALDRVRKVQATEQGAVPSGEVPTQHRDAGAEASFRLGGEASGPRTPVASSASTVELNLPLGPGKVVTLTAPARMTRAEKERLKTLLEHLIGEEEDTAVEKPE